MATYLKRTSKLFDNTLSRTYADVNLRDLMCPVCRGILIEPVTLPCTHNLCLRCLKGTFEHNSLSCPLCRVRVGSWLRAATKSETLVNNGLWELIRTKFAKEVEDKHNGDDGDIELNAGFSSTNKILSAAGEIRREYEIQLQMAEEEIRRQREAEQIASEALIRKLQAEEQEQLAQLAQDQLLAKTLAKKQVIEKQKETTKHCYTSNQSTIEELNFVSGTLTCDAGFVPLNNPESPRTSNLNMDGKNMNLSQVRENMEVRKSNAALVSKVRAERHASGLKTNSSNAFKDVSVKFCCQKTMPIYNTISRTLKHQTVTKITQPNTSNYLIEPGCSTSKIYGSQSKEELHVPSDVLSSKKKSLGIEVCMTVGEDDERIGSAESAGSHDSINQEIHHFKPIKAMPRTPLKISLDGKQIDPKLIRVIPILKRVYNTVPKPPSPTHLKRRIGCSWSAFRGKVRQDLKLKETLSKQEDIETKIEQKPSTSLVQSSPVSHKSTKYQVQDTSHRIELGHEVSIDSNKNYAKNINKVINGTKVGKKSILEESIDSGKIQKSWTTQHKNGMIGKGKRQKNTWSKKSTSHTTNRRDEDENDARDSVSSTSSTGVPQESEEQETYSEKDTAVENIAERIKRRKDPVNKKQKIPEHEPEDTAKRNRKRILPAKVKNLVSNTDSNELEAENKTEYTPRIKRKRTCRTSQRIVENNANESYKPELRKSTRNVRLRSNVTKTSEEQESIDKRIDDVKYDCSPSRVCVNEKDECMSENNNSELRISNKNGFSDEEIIKEQERIERLVLQEKEDFELAQRLQAKFNDMERIAGRTRRSRKAIESGNIELDLYKVDVKRTVCASPTGACTAKQSIVNQTMSSETKQRGRPRKRVK